MAFEALEIEVPKGLEETRLDRFLAPALSRRLGVTISRRRVRRWIEQGAVYVEGKRVRVASRALRPGWRVKLEVDPLAEERRVPLWEIQPQHLVFEDEHLLAIDKPVGVASQALRDDARDHLLAAVTRYLRACGADPASTRALGVHRLDRGTSGLVLVARSAAVAGSLGDAFAGQRVEKSYRAVVEVSGQRPADRWVAVESLALETLPGGRRRAVVSEEGRPAETELRTLAGGEGRAWIEARPRTGRTHQIRIHLAHCGLPIVGDRLYGPGVAGVGAGSGRQRLMLHAHRLVLDHPITGRRLDLVSPLPAGFAPPVDDGAGRRDQGRAS